jgi:hypothetical protein
MPRRKLYKISAVDKAAELAQEYHKGQVDKQGVNYFKGHLTTVGNAGHKWIFTHIQSYRQRQGTNKKEAYFLS